MNDRTRRRRGRDRDPPAGTYVVGMCVRPDTSPLNDPLMRVTGWVLVTN